MLNKKLGYRKIKVGHAGTLDPLATGVLTVCVGKATKQADLYQQQEKEYLATVRLGATTPSFDLETEVDQEYPYNHITLDLIKERMSAFQGHQMQVPPLFSAKFVNGGRAYKLARRGVEMELDAVPVNIYELDVLEYSPPLLKLRIRCSKGTYIRALARDIGRALDSGGHLVALERTASGSFRVEDALTIDFFEKSLTDVQQNAHSSV